jgi:MFS family permease
LAQTWGRRPVFLLGFATLPLRGVLLALTNDPYMVVAVQTLDGISGAVMGVLVPLALADIARGTGRFNLAQGIVGSATGIGATLSTVGAGYLADRFGVPSAFWGLAGMGVLALLLLFAMLPETRPSNGS